MTGNLFHLRRFGRLPSVCLGVWLALALFAPVAVHAQANGSFTGTATAEAVINDRLSLIQAEQLDFGTMAVGSNGGTVVVSPFGVRTLGVGSTVILAGGAPTAARFDGYGTRNQQVRIFISASPITIQRQGGPATAPNQMTVGNFTLGITSTSGASIIGAGNGAPRLRISRANGLFDFRIGATLTVKPSQIGGHYTGTYELTANYN
jgi:Mat/Ecp fimbriae major subunit